MRDKRIAGDIVFDRLEGKDSSQGKISYKNENEKLLEDKKIK